MYRIFRKFSRGKFMRDALEVIRNRIAADTDEEKAQVLEKVICAFEHLSFPELMLHAAYLTDLCNTLAGMIRSMDTVINGTSKETNWPHSCNGIRNGYNTTAFHKEFDENTPFVQPKFTDNESQDDETDGRYDTDLDEEDNDDSGEEESPNDPEEYNTSRGLRKTSKKKQGKQKGSKGHGFSFSGEVINNPPQYYLPERCMNCPVKDKCLANAKVKAFKYIYDIRLVSCRDAYYSVEMECPETGEVLSSSLPDEIAGHTRYGDNLKALAMTLRDIGLISYSRISEILKAITSYSVSAGTLVNISHELYEKIESSGAIDQIKEDIRKSDVVNADESGVSCADKMIQENNKSKLWAHTAVTATAVFIAVSMCRGLEGMLEIGLIAQLSCVLQHDFWKSYFGLDNVVHAMCGAHLLRELLKMMRFYPEVYMPAFGMFKLLNEMVQARNQTIEQGKHHIEPELVERFLYEYDCWTEMGIMASPVIPEDHRKKRGRKKQSAPMNLFIRFKDHKEEILHFLVDFRISFSNNRAESSFRLLKTAIKVFGTFRTIQGAHEFVTGFSYLQTCRLRGVNRYQAIYRAFKGQAKDVLNESKPVSE